MYFLIMHMLRKFTKAAYLGVSGRFWAFLGGVDLFSARNCYIANLLFDYTHSVKISAQTDLNSQNPLLRPKKGILGGIFAPLWGPPGGTEKKILKNDSTY